VEGLPDRTVTVAAQAPARIARSGRPDNTYDVAVLRDGGPIFTSVETVACDPLGAEVAVTATCLTGNGRIDVTLVNTTGTTAAYSVVVGSLAPRNRNLAPGEETTVSVTGRPDGPIGVVVNRDGAQIFTSTETVACDGPAAEATVSTSCLAGRGRVDVVLSNPTAASAVYDVVVGQLAPRTRTLTAGASDMVSVTGRPDGPIDVEVSRDGVVIDQSTHIIACG